MGEECVAFEVEGDCVLGAPEESIIEALRSSLLAWLAA